MKKDEKLIEAVDIQHKRIEDLERIIGAIAEIIYMEMPLDYQDEWLHHVREQGLYEPETEEILREQEQ